jgi:hypothetical protein
MGGSSMTKDTNKSQRQQTLEEARAWWEKLTETEKIDQMKKGRLVDSEKIRLAMRSRLKDWDQVDLDQYRQRMSGDNN